MTASIKLICGIIGVLCVFQYSEGSTPCNSSTYNLQECLQQIRNVAQDTSRFFFGSSYISKCPPEKAFEMDCFNIHGTRNKSIESILFKPGTFDPNLIDKYLNVTFTSPAGEYKACGHHYWTKEHTFTLDPSSNKTHKPWDLRMTPQVTWNHDPNDPNNYYTLIVQDVGASFLHGVYINIPRNETSLATVIDHYHGPRNFRNIINPYVFMLFDQGSNKIELGPKWTAIFNLPYLPNFNVSDFRDDMGMKGPVALNWILTSFDPYAVSLQKASGIAENCGYFVRQALAKHDTQFLPNGIVPAFSVYMKVQFHNYWYRFQYCCQQYQYDEKKFYLDPIGNGSELAGETRTGNPVVFHVTMNKLFPNVTDFNGKMYTMLAVDPDLPVVFASFGTKKLPLVHMLALNGQVDNTGMIMFDREIYPWRGPLPPNDKPHGYYFLLFEQQSGKVEIVDSTPYSDPSCASTTAYGRCLFNIDMFSSDNNLRFVSASWFFSMNDDYINKTRGVTEMDSCPGKLPCPRPPVGVSSFTVASTAVLLLSVIIAGIIENILC